jgi:hypothetical protein
MLKINYPADLTRLNSSYLKSLNVTELQTSLDILYSRPNFQTIQNKKNATEWLTMNFEDLTAESFRLKNLITEEQEIIEIKKVFNYGSSETGYLGRRNSKIADFFMENRSNIKLSSCYYCNVDYIFAFENIGDFEDEIHFLNKAEMYEIEQISEFGIGTSKKIKENRAIQEIISIDDARIQLTDPQKQNLLNFKVKELKNHFTLDHVLNKADHPFAALSLYNFVPCCFACNSKFKRDNKLIATENDSILSPTSQLNDVNDDIKFKLYFSNGLKYKQNKATINSVDDFTLDLSSKKNTDAYKRYISIFKLKERYVFHKPVVYDIIKKEKSYSASRISEIATLMNKTDDEVKADIFGEDLVNKNDFSNPFSKLKIDIADNIDL